VRSRVLPMSDHDVRTHFHTDAGWLGFQEYFVRERLQPRLLGLRFDGLEEARPTQEVAQAIREADLVIIGPSNPLISIGPIMALVEPLLDPGRVLAVSPLVAGRALKGPTVEMMRALRGDASLLRVAEEYSRCVRYFVLDHQDAESAPAVQALGYRVLTADTVMESSAAAGRLAAEILHFAVSTP
jgi:LPPG:FO 2-phospho-L-lactate transferase